MHSPASPHPPTSAADRLWREANQALSARQLPEATRLGDALLRIEPNSARAHWLLGSIALDSADMGTAVAQTEAAARSAHGLPMQQRVAVTRQLIDIGSFERAWHLLRSALDGQDVPAPVRVAIGEQLLMLERHREALDCLLAAERQGLRHPMLSFLISTARRHLGDFPGAIDAAEATLRLQPDFAHAHWALALMGARNAAGARIDRIQRSIDSLQRRGDAGAPQLRMGLSMLWHALFRELDSMDERDRAWNALVQGLAIKRAVQPHDRAGEDRLFDMLIRAYDAAFLRSTEPFAAATHGNHTPIFIVGLPRTGTTLLERILTNHSRVAACGELNELQLLVKRATGHWCRPFMDEVVAGRLASADLSSLGQAYLGAISWRADGKPFVVDKHQSNYQLAGAILRCLPQARILHMRRDAMDACFSNLKEPFAAHAYSYSNEQLDAANHYRNYDRLMRHLQAMAGDRILQVDYEELVRDHAGQSARILRFTGLQGESGIDDITRNRTPVASASSVQVREPIHDRNIGAWRRYASQLEPLAQALSD